MKLKFSLSAQRDLVRLREFIAQKNPSAATRISQRLLQAIKHIVTQPEMGVDLAEVSGVQDLVSGDYIVRYTVIDDVETVYILRIWHCKEER